MPSFAALFRIPIVFAFVTLASAQQSQYSTPCRRWLHQTCIVDNKLYTDGGLVVTGSSFTNQSAQTNGYLIWEDLTKLPVDSAPDAGFPSQTPLPKPANVPIVTGGALWPDDANKLFYLYGGSYYDTKPTTFQLWLYDAIYNTWNATTPGDGQSTIQPTTNGAGAVDALRRAYYYGGYANSQTSPGWSGGQQMQSSLVVYDMNANSWESLIPSTGNVPRAEGALLYLPASDQGMLIYIGGLQQQSNGTEEFLPMSQIQLFDVKSQKWYNQTAGGTLPPNRRGFCGGATWADDYSSYNIYLYGGFDESGNGLNDAWILSLPSFEWIQYYKDPTYPDPHGHGWLTCNVYSRSQMIIIGGNFSDTTLPDCDAQIQSNQHGMSLGQQNVANATWYTLEPNVTTYSVPGNITSVIGGGATGGATLRSPSPAGWGSNQDLAVYFARSYTATQTPTRYPPTSSSTSSSNSGGGGTDVGAIAGGVVGGVVGLVIILGLALYCLRRRKNAKKSQPNTIDDSRYQGHGKNSPYVSETQHPSPQTQQQQYYTPQDSPQVAHSSPQMHHQNFSQSSQTWFQESPVQQTTSGTNWNPVPVYQAGPTQPAGPAPMQSTQTYYPPPPRPQHSSHGEETEGRAELSATRTPVPLDGIMLKSEDRQW